MNSKEGLGQENNAAGGAYSAIIAFNEYYGMLSEHDKSHIPQQLTDEIQKLLDLASDSNRNKNATQNLDTCIATRRDTLLAAIKGHETVLKNTAVGDKEKTALKDSAQKQWDDCKTALSKSLQNKYSGNDTLSFVLP